MRHVKCLFSFSDTVGKIEMDWGSLPAPGLYSSCTICVLYRFCSSIVITSAAGGGGFNPMHFTLLDWCTSDAAVPYQTGSLKRSSITHLQGFTWPQCSLSTLWFEVNRTAQRTNTRHGNKQNETRLISCVSYLACCLTSDNGRKTWIQDVDCSLCCLFFISIPYTDIQ